MDLRAAATDESVCRVTSSAPVAGSSPSHKASRPVSSVNISLLWTLLLFAGIYLALTLAIVCLMRLPKDPILHDVALAVPAVASIAVTIAWHESKAILPQQVDGDVSAWRRPTRDAES